MKSHVLALCAGVAIFLPASAFAEPVKAVATFSILGDMVAEVGGERVAVTTLVGPGGDAHVYQPTPRDARTVAEADVVFINGLGFEGFLERLIEAAEYKGTVVTAAATVKPIESSEEEDHEESHAEAGHEADDDHGHDHGAEKTAEAVHASDQGHDAHDDHAGHDHGDLDPHAWQSVANAVLYVEEIREGLCAVDVEGCPTFEANAARYTAELMALDAEIRSRIGAVPPAQRFVVTSHDAFGYFGAEYGVQFLAPQGISTDSEASAQDVAGLIRQIRETGVKTVFLEAMVDPRLIEQIGREGGATVGGQLFSDALSAPGGGGESYIAAMRHNVDALVRGMASGS